MPDQYNARVFNAAHRALDEAVAEAARWELPVVRLPAPVPHEVA